MDESKQEVLGLVYIIKKDITSARDERAPLHVVSKYHFL